MPTITTKIETKKQTILDIRDWIEKSGDLSIFDDYFRTLLIYFAQ